MRKPRFNLKNAKAGIPVVANNNVVRSVQRKRRPRVGKTSRVISKHAPGGREIKHLTEYHQGDFPGGHVHYHATKGLRGGRS